MYNCNGSDENEQKDKKSRLSASTQIWDDLERMRSEAMVTQLLIEPQK